MSANTCIRCTCHLQPGTCGPDAINLRKSVRRYLVILARVTLPAFGFAFICLGAFLLSMQQGEGGQGGGGVGGQTARLVLAYACVTVGFLLLITGVSWTVFLGMKSKVYQQRSQSRPSPRTTHVLTVDRPGFYPPSYEESQARTASTVTVVTEATWVSETEPSYNIAPPLYTLSATEATTEDYSSEDPPSYKDAVLQGHSQSDAHSVGSPTPEATPPSPH